jgi:signal transduction histidine kinase
MTVRPLWRQLDPYGDAAIAIALLVFGLVNIATSPSRSYPPPRALDFLFLAAVAVPFVARRRAPVAVLAVVMGASLAWIYVLFPLSQQGPFEAFVALIAATYTAAAYTSGRDAAVSLGVVVVGVAAGVLTGALGGQPAGDYIPFALWIAVAYVVGRVFRRRQLLAARLGDRLASVERDRDADARHAVAEERARIARELHDVIAHSVSVMVVQAGAGERVLEEDPHSARESFRSIRETGGQTLIEMRRLLGLLRHDEHALSLAPQPSIARLGALVHDVSAAGLPTSLRIEGEQKPLAPGIELSAYRIVQEALTNVRKHAAAGRADVVVSYGNDEVTIEVLDDGTGGPKGNGSGHGLIGMRERAALYGGTIVAGVRPEGGFRVRAVLPLQHQPS